MHADGEARGRFAVDQYGRSTSNLDARLALHAKFSIATQTWHEWLFEMIALVPGEVVVEVGSGTGQLWASNTMRLPGDVQLHLTDVSMAMCERLRAEVPTAAVYRADAQQLPLRDGIADVVVANHMLYHVPDQALALKEAARVLRPSGRAVFATNGADHMKELWSLLDEVGLTSPHVPVTHSAFLLEDAQRIVGSVFEQCSLTLFDDALHVTDPEAVLRYIESFAAVTSSQRQALLANIHRRMTDGCMTITKSAGTLTASLGRPLMC